MSRALIIGITLFLASPPTIASESAPAPGLGTVSGFVQFPGCHVPDDLEVCAEPPTGGTEVPCVAPTLSAKGPRYALQLPAGRYRIFARAPSVDTNYRAYYTAAVTCGLTADCRDHRPQLVTVRAGQVTDGISPADWVTPEFEPLPSTLALAH